MSMSKKEWNKLSEYVDFEYRVIGRELTHPTSNPSTTAKYFKQVGKRLSELKGMDKALQREMVALTEVYTTRNFFEFGEKLVGLNNPEGLLTMQMLATFQSDLSTRHTVIPA